MSARTSLHLDLALFLNPVLDSDRPAAPVSEIILGCLELEPPPSLVSTIPRDGGQAASFPWP